MEPALMMQTATGLLAGSAAGGLIMAAMRFSGKPHPPISLAMLHGFLSAAALTLLRMCHTGDPPERKTGATRTTLVRA